jgi:inner membrane protein YidH
MATDQSDPRVFFAAERTLLAWLRTGLTIIGLGFVISRFGLFIQLLGMQSHLSSANSNTFISAILGISFVVIGSLLIAVAAIQHRRFITTLSPEQLPETYNNMLAFAMSIFIALLGVALAIYLWIA